MSWDHAVPCCSKLLKLQKCSPRYIRLHSAPVDPMLGLAAALIITIFASRWRVWKSWYNDRNMPLETFLAKTSIELRFRSLIWSLKTTVFRFWFIFWSFALVSQKYPKCIFAELGTIITSHFYVFGLYISKCEGNVTKNSPNQKSQRVHPKKVIDVSTQEGSKIDQKVLIDRGENYQYGVGGIRKQTKNIRRLFWTAPEILFWHLHYLSYHQFFQS